MCAHLACEGGNSTFVSRCLEWSLAVGPVKSAYRNVALGRHEADFQLPRIPFLGS
jgi:hypothetical protein